MKDLHKNLGKYNVCILPNPGQHFEDGMPLFSIFTANCEQKQKKAVDAKDEARFGMYDPKQTSQQIMHEFATYAL